MKRFRRIIDIWAIAQIIIGLAVVVSTAVYAPPTFEKMREESRRTGANLLEISDALAAVRTTYAETSTNLFTTAGELEDVEEKLKDAGGKLGDVGHLFEKRGQKFERAERHNRESTIFWGKLETPFAKYIADIYGDLKEWTLAASTNLCDVGRDLSHVSRSIGKQREAIAEFQNDRHPKVLQAMETSSKTISHVGENLSYGDSIATLSRSVNILCGIIALLFIGNGIVLLVVGAEPLQPSPTPHGT